jgi:hypothetical protein
MAELKDVEFKDQHMLVRHAIRAWLPAINKESNPRLMNASLTGDYLWNEEHQHGWVGVCLDWHGTAEVHQVLIEGGEIVAALPMEECSGDYQEYVFMRVFGELAEFDAMTKSTDPIAMYGLRQAADLEAIHGYYEENN